MTTACTTDECVDGRELPCACDDGLVGSHVCSAGVYGACSCAGDGTDAGLDSAVEDSAADTMTAADSMMGADTMTAPDAAPLSCSTPSDCDDSDPCTADACEAAACAYAPVDADEDGAAPIACGGSDCDDLDPAIGPSIPETCNGVDQDCDGVIDAPLVAGACPNGHVCDGGSCVCAASSVSCGSAGCVDTSSHPLHCGDCFSACDPGYSCITGMCTCDVGGTVCGGECADLNTSIRNCGACFNRCNNAGESCVGGSCSCTGGETLCPAMFRCADLTSDSEACGSCSNSCFAGTTCAVSTCSQERAWETVFAHQASGSRVALVSVDDSDHVVFATTVRGDIIDRGPGPSTPGTTILTTPSTRNDSILVTRHTRGGARLWERVYDTRVGTTIGESTSLSSMDTGSSGDIVIAGNATGTIDFGPFNLTTSDHFVAKLNAAGVPQWGVEISSTVTSSVRAVRFDDTGSVWVLGMIQGDHDFGGGILPDEGTDFCYVVQYSSVGAHQRSWRAPGNCATLTIEGSELVVGGFFRATTDFGTGPIDPGRDGSSYLIRYTMAGSLVHGPLLSVGSSAVPVGSDYLGRATGESVGRYTRSDTTVWSFMNTATASAWTSGIDLRNGHVLIAGTQRDGYDFGTGELEYGMFVASLTPGGVAEWGLSFDGDSRAGVSTVAVDSTGRAYVTGSASEFLGVGTDTFEAETFEDLKFILAVDP